MKTVFFLLVLTKTSSDQLGAYLLAEMFLDFEILILLPILKLALESTLYSA